jgi:hypothetical protein
MIMRLVLASAMVLALVCSAARAQESAGIPEAIIQELDGLVGTWEVEGNIGDISVKGQRIIRWVRSEDGRKICLMTRVTDMRGDNSVSGVSLIGWNAVENRIEDRGFGANGEHATLSWTVESPGKWNGDWKFIEGGVEMKSTAVLIKKSPREYLVEGTIESGVAFRQVLRKVADAKKRGAKQ